MNSNDSHPLLSAEAQALLNAERDVPTLPEPQRSALVGRVLSAAVRAPLPDQSWWRPQGLKRWAAVLGAVALSSGAVWAKYSGALGPSAVPVASVPRPAPAAVPPVGERRADSRAGHPAGEVLALPPVSSESAPKALGPASHSGKNDLARNREELAGLEEARTAQQRGDFAGALRAIDAHERRFPRSLFAEDREALRVSALGKLGRTAEARSRALAFVARYPRSVFIAKLRPWLEK